MATSRPPTSTRKRPKAEGAGVRPVKSSRAAAVPTEAQRNPSPPPVAAVIERARTMGLMTSNTQQVGARLPNKLLERAKRRTGIVSTTDLLAFAVANLAVDDDFAASFVAARGKLDPDIDVGF